MSTYSGINGCGSRSNPPSPGEDSIFSASSLARALGSNGYGDICRRSGQRPIEPLAIPAGYENHLGTEDRFLASERTEARDHYHDCDQDHAQDRSRPKLDIPPRPLSSSCNGPASTRGQLATTGTPSKAPVQESAILTAVRRQMDSLEDKLSTQIARVQQQSDRLRDVALSRVDSKMGTMEAQQPKLDRRIAELSGNYKGLSDEMQALIRRIDQMDSRMWDWRHSLEEEVRQKFVDIEQQQQQMSSSMRVTHATNEDLIKRFNKRLQRTENVLDEKVASSEDTHQSLMNLHTRLADVESAGVNMLSLPLRGQSFNADKDLQQLDKNTQLLSLESKLTDVGSRLEHIIQEVHDNHARVEAQEERLRSMRTLFETKEEHSRWINERLERVDWEGRFKEFNGQMQDLNARKLEHSEKLEVMQRKLDELESLHDQTLADIRSFQDRLISQMMHQPEHVPDSPPDFDGRERMPALMQCLTRADETDLKLDALTTEVEAIRADFGLGPRVAALVEQLREVAPKLIDQENSIRELHEKVGRLDLQTRKPTPDWGGPSINGFGGSEAAALLEVRTERLESEVARLRLQVSARSVTERDR